MDYQKNQNEPMLFYNAMQDEFPSAIEDESEITGSQGKTTPSKTILSLALMQKAMAGPPASQPDDLKEGKKSCLSGKVTSKKKIADKNPKIKETL